MGLVSHTLAVILDFLQLVHGLLEFELGVLDILFELFFLLLQEFKFALPERAILIIVVNLVLELD